MINLLYTINGLRVNGMSAVIMQYISMLNLKEYHISILTDEIAPQFVSELEKCNVHVLTTEKRRKNPFAYYQELKSVLKNNKFDVIHAHGNSATIAVEMMAAKQSKLLQYINDECDICIFGYQNVNSEKELMPQKNCIKNMDYDGYLFLDQVFEDTVSHYFWDKVFKKQFLIRSGFCKIPKITMGDDLAAHIKMGLKCPKVKCYKDVLYNYYNDGSGVSRKPGPKTAEIVQTLSYIEETITFEGVYGKYEKLIDFHYFRSFLFYVVKNKYGWTDVQKVIYKAWKSKKISINKNEYIQDYMSNAKKELMLAKIYHFNSILGRMAAFVYLKLKRGN